MIKTQLQLALTTDLSNKFKLSRTKFDYIFLLSITAKVAEFPPLRLHIGEAPDLA
jgi:hypothetical protein